METPAEKYQRKMRENMETFQSILDESEYCFTNTDDACGDEIYEIFKKTADISDGLLSFISGEIKALEERNFEVNIAYNFNFEKEILLIILKYNLRLGIQIPKVANMLNELLKLEGYSGDKYYYDISQDVGMSGIAFTNFTKEYKLFESGTGLIYRGESESENSEGFEYFWAKLNEYKSNTKGESIENKRSKIPILAELTKNPISEQEEFCETNVKEDFRRNQNLMKPWWKIW